MLVIVWRRKRSSLACSYFLAPDVHGDIDLLGTEGGQHGLKFFSLRASWSVGLNRLIDWSWYVEKSL
jgi:hypothetical protein